jgi:quercetin 2,3-dioxygenase
MSIYYAFLGLCMLLFQQEVMNHNIDNTTMRTIKKLHKAEYSKIGDLITYRAVPTNSIDEELDPFIFLNHHGPQVYKPDNNGLPFGPHPHKGFETVTFILKGDILHKDTQGHESLITEGGIQWMTAGSGVVHSEVSSPEFKSEGGEIEILQLWINLPAKHKRTVPKYIGLQKDTIPALSYDEGKTTVHLVSGSWEDKKAPIQSLTGIHMTWIDFKAGGSLNARVDTSRTVFLYVVKGELKINHKITVAHHLVEFNNDGEDIEVEALTDGIILFGHGQPNKEPIVARGPFVMNSMDEIREAYREYEEGKFGELE